MARPVNLERPGLKPEDLTAEQEATRAVEWFTSEIEYRRLAFACGWLDVEDALNESNFDVVLPLVAELSAALRLLALAVERRPRALVAPTASVPPAA
jgi:hypothetical protein